MHTKQTIVTKYYLVILESIFAAELYRDTIETEKTI